MIEEIRVNFKDSIYAVDFRKQPFDSTWCIQSFSFNYGQLAKLANMSEKSFIEYMKHNFNAIKFGDLSMAFSFEHLENAKNAWEYIKSLLLIYKLTN
jgi:hypothetical protein